MVKEDHSMEVSLNNTVVGFVALLVILQMLDLLTTYLALNLGIPEGNPLFTRFGSWFMFLYKIAVSIPLGFVPILFRRIRDLGKKKLIVKLLKAITYFYIFVVTWNAIGLVIVSLR